MNASSNNPPAAPGRASTPSNLSAPSATGERRKSAAYDSAPSQGIWEADREKKNQGFLKKLMSNKLAPSFLK
ncbi:uncharacterized protein RCC_07264 [Ramularia collo-cygni]|uniref:Uncharacterized protein n=1 Tax=Ramularia collo-cygni TaxID=112498 RepID=A0A2D3UX62_9PEZI|nr:uncharacterized protein RCC_07264 [Ramularia collo-cygni]CZT21401.1 uncharacterized protein RCC_07264 [Ramularia collo-cygni]